MRNPLEHFTSSVPRSLLKSYRVAFSKSNFFLFLNAPVFGEPLCPHVYQSNAVVVPPTCHIVSLVWVILKECRNLQACQVIGSTGNICRSHSETQVMEWRNFMFFFPKDVQRVGLCLCMMQDTWKISPSIQYFVHEFCPLLKLFIF